MYIVLGILILGLIIMVHEFGHFIIAKLFHVGVIEFSIGMGPKLIQKRYKDTVYSLRIFPIGGYCAMYGESAQEATQTNTLYKTDWQPNQALKSIAKWKQLCILIAGPAFNILLGLLSALCFTIGFGAVSQATITEIQQDSPAYEANIDIGDTIIGINDTETLTANDYVLYLSLHQKDITNGYDLQLQTEKELTKTVHVIPNPETKQIGITYNADLVKQSGLHILKYTGNSAMYWVKTTIGSLKLLITGEAKLSDLSGIIGTTGTMSNLMKSAMENHTFLRTLLTLISFLSITIGIMNLLPLPALDGGRIVLTSFEILTRTTIPERIELAINSIGILLLLMIMLLTAIHDTIVLLPK